MLAIEQVRVVTGPSPEAHPHRVFTTSRPRACYILTYRFFFVSQQQPKQIHENWSSAPLRIPAVQAFSMNN
jgi:hypothetical protein